MFFLLCVVLVVVISCPLLLLITADQQQQLGLMMVVVVSLLCRVAAALYKTALSRVCLQTPSAHANFPPVVVTIKLGRAVQGSPPLYSIGSSINYEQKTTVSTTSSLLNGCANLIALSLLLLLLLLFRPWTRDTIRLVDWVSVSHRICIFFRGAPPLFLPLFPPLPSYICIISQRVWHCAAFCHCAPNYSPSSLHHCCCCCCC